MFLPQMVLVVSPGSPVAAPNECDGKEEEEIPVFATACCLAA
jgi:hypothetical protein